MFDGKTNARQLKEAYFNYKNFVPKINDTLKCIENIGVRCVYLNVAKMSIIQHFAKDPCFVLNNYCGPTFHVNVVKLLGHYLYKLKTCEKTEYEDLRVYFSDNLLEKDSSNEEEKFVDEFAYEFLLPKSEFGFLLTFFYSKKSIKQRFYVDDLFYNERIANIKSNKKDYSKIKFVNQYEECKSIVDMLYKSQISNPAKETVNTTKLKRKIVLDSF